MARGGARLGAGRPKGSHNRATDLEKVTLARQAKGYASNALAALDEIARTGKQESARVTAAIAILDRAYGRPFRMPEEPPENPLGDLVEELMRNAESAPIATQQPGQGRANPKTC